MPESLPIVGFIGLGQMGVLMAARLAEAGHALTVLDIRTEVTRDFSAGHRARVADGPADLAANARVLITMLPDGKTVHSALTEADGAGAAALDRLCPGSIVIDMGSSAPHETSHLGALLAERGVAMIDAPVSGGVRRARTGTLAIMAGGESPVIDRCEPLLLTMGSTVTRTGPLGSGHAAKALNNAVSAAGLIAACEALIVGKQFGIDPKVLLEILNASTGRNNATENKIEQFVFSRSYASGFALDLLAKDVRTAHELADQVGVVDPVTEVTSRTVGDAGRWLGPAADHTEVASFLEHQSETTLMEDAEPQAEAGAR